MTDSSVFSRRFFTITSTVRTIGTILVCFGRNTADVKFSNLTVPNISVACDLFRLCSTIWINVIDGKYLKTKRKKKNTREHRSDEVFVFSSVYVGPKPVVVLITNSVRFHELGVLPVTLTFCRIQNGRDRGQRPGRQHHCSVPIHRKPYSTTAHTTKRTSN